jgi:hypothetical protein
MLVDINTFACKIRTGSIALSTTTCTLDKISNSSYFIVTMKAPCTTTCSSGTVYTIELSGVQNPEWINTGITKSIEIQTMSNDFLWIKDRKTVTIFTTPELIEGPITSRSISKIN